MSKGRGVKIGNPYARLIGRMYANTPKAVFAAIAISYASAGGDRLDIAEENILREWTALWYSGVIPQKPPRIVEGLEIKPS